MRSHLKAQQPVQSSFTATPSKLVRRRVTHPTPLAEVPPILHEALNLPNLSTQPLLIQPKLQVGAVNDRSEQEADRLAAAAVHKLHFPAQPTIQPQIQPNRKIPLQTPLLPHQSNLSSTAVAPDVEAGIQQSRGAGQPLSETMRAPMEQIFAADFSQVRVHTDGESDRLNRAITANAFTTGQDIFFRQGAYVPESSDGQQLIAHELTHVVQQNRQPSLHPVIQRQISKEDILEKFDVMTYYINTKQFEGKADFETIPEDVEKLAKVFAEIATEFEATVGKTGIRRIRLIEIFQNGLVEGRTKEIVIERAAEFCRENNIKVPEKYSQLASSFSIDEIQGFHKSLFEARQDVDPKVADALSKTGMNMPEAFPAVSWVGSGPDPKTNLPAIDKGEKGKNNFAEWMVALISKDPKAEQFAPKSIDPYQMNCWEGVMYTAYQAKLVDEAWLRDVHEKAAKSEEHYFDSIAESLGFNRAVPYEPLHKLVPEPGDIVFFDETEHIALALGGEKLLHLWHSTEGAGKGFEITTFEAIFYSRPDFRLKTKFAPPLFKFKVKIF